MKLLFGLLAFTALLNSAQAAKPYKEVKLPPVEEAASDPTFSVYLKELKAAAANKDKARLLPLLSKSIKYSFGADVDSIASFERNWGLAKNPGQSKLWPELSRVLSEGVARESDGHFSAPYYFSRWPENMDAFESKLIFGANVPVVKKAAASAPTLRQVSYLAVIAEEAKAGWVKVRLPSGEEGFVEEKSMRSPVGYRAIFRKEGKKWLMTHFIAGD